ncbi:MAG: hypothetical protein KDD35_01005 [Bdellovibrionales bacterium]|nr:hypothetical protein [Bdellovibrionales bacterium]
MAPQSSNKEWDQPNLQILLPYTFFQSVSDPWYSQIQNLLVQVHQGKNPEELGRKLIIFFEMKYGKSGHFDVGSDTLLIAQMKKFLGLFSILLTAIAFLSLTVGGIGITNMMLVSVSERLKEIGIRKAFGATRLSLRIQYLFESLVICSLAGLIFAECGCNSSSCEGRVFFSCKIKLNRHGHLKHIRTFLN